MKFPNKNETKRKEVSPGRFVQIPGHLFGRTFLILLLYVFVDIIERLQKQ